MADPRGRGLARGQGLWHKFTDNQKFVANSVELQARIGPRQLGWEFYKYGQDGQAVYRLGTVLAYLSDGVHQAPGIWVMYDDETVIRYHPTTWWEVTSQVERYNAGKAVTL